MRLKQQLRNGLLIFLKYTLNPLTRRLARSSFGPFTIVRHVGRRSGKQYETPIIVSPVKDGFVIELTYGYDVDWHKNVLAAGGCTMVWHGKEYVIRPFRQIVGLVERCIYAGTLLWLGIVFAQLLLSL